MNKQQLIENIRRKQSFLCVGLDTDIKKIPQHLLQEEDPIFAFNQAIIEATAPYCVAYKPNMAFYESLGVQGIIAFEKTVKYLREHHPDQFIIADAKRGDIGNTSEMYARSFFDHIKVDAVTVAPYMGEDSVKPFLLYPEAWVILLALIVVGATRPEKLAEIRRYCPDHFLLVPGVGAQGGSLAEVAKYGMNDECGLLVNSSRAIIYADKSERFAEAAGEAAKAVQEEMAGYLKEKGL